MIFIDFEAAGLDSYPIEVGFAAVEADRSICSASRLIYERFWDEQFDWSPAAEALHGITREQLRREGLPAVDVAAWLNEQIGGMVVLSDSRYDQLWTTELYIGAVMLPAFCGPRDITHAFSGIEIDERRFQPAKRQADRSAPIRHRAEADARHLATWYAQSLAIGAPVHRLIISPDGPRRVALAEVP